MLGNLLGPIVTTALIKLYTDAEFWFTDAITASTADSSKLYASVFKQLGLSVLVPLVCPIAGPSLHDSIFSSMTSYPSLTQTIR